MIEIPETVSGRPVTNRGVHLVPFGYHGGWCNREKRGYWQELFRRTYLSWAVLINEGDSVLEVIDGMTPLQILLDAGVIPIIRDKKKFPRKITCQDTARRTVEVYARYGLKPFWILYNEPFDSREWIGGDVPPYEEAWATIANCWMSGASDLAEIGCYVGFPDGPGYDDNPFDRIKDGRWLWDEGHAYYTTHTYGKGRPVNYPYDEVTQKGVPLTDAEYRAALDDFADDPAWYDLPLEMINDARRRLAHPGLTAIEDDTCWLGWEKVAYWAKQTLGYVPPMAMTEGGWVPRDRAGSGPNTDIRWPHTTPKMVAKKTLEMYNTAAPTFALCPWLLGDDSMVTGGYVGWPYDAWTGWAYAEHYGFEKPVIETLANNPPSPGDPLQEATDKVRLAREKVAAASNLLEL